MKANCLAPNSPNQDLLICGDHPILNNDEEVTVSSLVNNKTIINIKLDRPAFNYTPCTLDRTYIMINGVPVCTWSKLDFESQEKQNSFKKARVGYTKQ